MIRTHHPADREYRRHSQEISRDSQGRKKAGSKKRGEMKLGMVGHLLLFDSCDTLVLQHLNDYLPILSFVAGFLGILCLALTHRTWGEHS
jgi:hypothetical protein